MEDIINEKENEVNKLVSDTLEQFQDELKDKFGEMLQDKMMDLENELLENIDKELEETKKEIQGKEEMEKPMSIKDFVIATNKDKNNIEEIHYKSAMVIEAIEIKYKDGKTLTAKVEFIGHDYEQHEIGQTVEEAVEEMRLDMGGDKR